jgi:hypothetical protein
MGTDLCTSKSLESLYGVQPTMKILKTQPMINISMEEMDTTVSDSEHSVGSILCSFPHGELRLSRLLHPGTMLLSMHLAAQEGAKVLIPRRLSTSGLCSRTWDSPRMA